MIDLNSVCDDFEKRLKSKSGDELLEELETANKMCGGISMNREILFKAKRVDNGEWIKGDLIIANGQINSGKAYILNGVSDFSYGDNGNRCRIGCFVEVGPSTVCEFTGLTDKNGAKIFEGDILRFCAYGYCYTGTVKYHKASFCIMCRNPDASPFLDDAIERHEAESIGNIYDNPELLEEKTNDNC